MSYETEKARYQEMSEEFTELNKQVNRAAHKEELSDELELSFFRAQKALKEQYSVMQRAKIAESAGEEE